MNLMTAPSVGNVRNAGETCGKVMYIVPGSVKTFGQVP